MVKTSDKKTPKVTKTSGKGGRGKDQSKKSKSVKAGLQFPVTR
jgi:hypothetical protein